MAVPNDNPPYSSDWDTLPAATTWLRGRAAASSSPDGSIAEMPSFTLPSAGSGSAPRVTFAPPSAAASPSASMSLGCCDPHEASLEEHGPPADAGDRAVADGVVYVRCTPPAPLAGVWRLGRLTVSRDHLRFVVPRTSGAAGCGSGATRPFCGIDVVLPCVDVAGARILSTAAAGGEKSVFQVTLLPSAAESHVLIADDFGAMPNAAAPALSWKKCDSTEAAALRSDATAAAPPPYVWFKAADMGRAQEWAELIDDASQAADAAASGLIWDWFAVPASDAIPPKVVEFPAPAPTSMMLPAAAVNAASSPRLSSSAEGAARGGGRYARRSTVAASLALLPRTLRVRAELTALQ